MLAYLDKNVNLVVELSQQNQALFPFTFGISNHSKNPSTFREERPQGRKVSPKIEK